KHLPLEHIKTVNVGGFGERLRVLIDGEFEAVSLLPPQIDMAKQLGMRPVIEDRFITIWWVPEDMPQEQVRAYLSALQRAEEALNADLARYLPLWRNAVPPEFQDRDWDFSRFSKGETFVNEKLPEHLFSE